MMKMKKLLYKGTTSSRYVHKICILIVCCALPTLVYALGHTGTEQPTAHRYTDGIATSDQSLNDSVFNVYMHNEELQVYIHINLYNNTIQVPDQEVLGELPGYIGSKKDSRKWLITDATINGNVAHLTIINDYGSEDLRATLTYQGDGTYLFMQQEGSTIKFGINKKWVKLPKKVVFFRTDKQI